MFAIARGWFIIMQSTFRKGRSFLQDWGQFCNLNALQHPKLEWYVYLQYKYVLSNWMLVSTEDITIQVMILEDMFEKKQLNTRYINETWCIYMLQGKDHYNKEKR